MRRAYSLAAASLLFELMMTAQVKQDVTTLEPGQVIERDLSGGQADFFRVTLKGGECADLVVEQRGVDVMIQVVDDANTVTSAFESESRKFAQEQVVLVADTPQTFRIKIRPVWAKASAARYGVQFLRVRSTTEKDRLVWEAHKLDLDAIRFDYQSKIDEALEASQQAVAAAEKALGPDDAYVGELLYFLGFRKRTKGLFNEAERIFHHALEVDQKAKGRNDPQTAMVLRGLAELYTITGEYSKAESLLEEHVQIIESTLGSEHPRVALALRMLGNCHKSRGDFEGALRYFERASAMGEKVFNADDLPAVAMTQDLGEMYNALGDNDRAEPLVHHALDVLEKRFGSESLYIASPLFNLGRIALQRKQLPLALDYYTRAAAIRRKVQGNRHPDMAEAVMGIANVYGSMGEFDKALPLHKDVFEILMESLGPYHEMTLRALQNLAKTYAALGDIGSAVEHQVRYDQNLEKNLEFNLVTGSEREKFDYLSSVARQTDRTLSLHARQAPGNATARDLAALVLLQRQGRVLDAMSGSISALRERLTPGDRKLFDALADTSTKYAKLALNGPGKTPRAEYEKQLAAAGQEKEKLESAISARSAEFRAESQPVTLETVRSVIPADAALIQIAKYSPFDPKGDDDPGTYGEPRYIAYVLRSRGEIRWADLGPANGIDTAIHLLREAFRDPRSREAQSLARKLDDRVMKPVRSLVGDAKHLLVSPGGELSLIPFEALVDEQGRYLIERYLISYVTAGRDLLRMQIPRNSRADPLLIANPAFGEPTKLQLARVDHPQAVAANPRRSVTTGGDLSTVYFAPLAGTAEEARSIKSLFPEATVLTGELAAKSSLKTIDGPRILHIATHGFFLDDSPVNGAKPGDRQVPASTRAIHATINVANPLLRSGLALAGANLDTGTGNDGILTALEASNLNLWGTKVVTLSACETGVGQVRNGEGVYGLRRAFFLAGTETLVMSLWSVSDRVTREIMTGYYTRLKNGLGRGEALRQAQLAMLRRKERQHPFYWASFIQSGDWRRLDGN